jgi:hypothetical protein
LSWRLASRGDMAADDKNERGAACARTDQVGKVFVVVGQRVRKCLVCEQFFTRRAASKHAEVVCLPEPNMKPGRK